MGRGCGQGFRVEECAVDVVPLSECEGQEEASVGWMEGDVSSRYGHVERLDTYVRHCGAFPISQGRFSSVRILVIDIAIEACLLIICPINYMK